MFKFLICGVSKRVFFMAGLLFAVNLRAPVALPTIFDAAASQVAIQKCKNKFIAFNLVNLKASRDALQAKITAASSSSYASTSSVAAALASANALLTVLNEKLVSPPSSKNITDLDTAYISYTQYLSSQAYISELSAIKTAVDVTLTNFSVIADDAASSLGLAQGCFVTTIPGSVRPSFL